MTDAVKNIPAAFVCVLGDISKDRLTYTAEFWSFWFMYLAPILLKDHFQKNRYQDHMCMLVNIMKTTLKFEITTAEIDKLEVEIIRWVELYEKQVVVCGTC